MLYALHEQYGNSRGSFGIVAISLAGFHLFYTRTLTLSPSLNSSRFLACFFKYLVYLFWRCLIFSSTFLKLLTVCDKSILFYVGIFVSILLNIYYFVSFGFC